MSWKGKQSSKLGFTSNRVLIAVLEDLADAVDRIAPRYVDFLIANMFEVAPNYRARWAL
jgi:hypothetical protein